MIVLPYFKLLIGPMFSGKTTRLISEYERLSESKIKVICLKPSTDNRYSNEEKTTLLDTIVMCSRIVSHDGKKVKSYLIDLMDDKTVDKVIDHYDYFIIDEIQFINSAKSLISKILEKSKRVIAAGLSGDYRQRIFETISEIIPIASKLTLLHANCYFCLKESCYTKRTNNISNDTILVGGKDIYYTVCLKCFYK